MAVFRSGLLGVGRLSSFRQWVAQVVDRANRLAMYLAACSISSPFKGALFATLVVQLPKACYYPILHFTGIYTLGEGADDDLANVPWAVLILYFTIIGPMLETTALCLISEVTRFGTKRAYAAILVPALILGPLHGFDGGVPRAFPATWAFWMFSYLYVNTRKVGIKRAWLSAFWPHVFGNTLAIGCVLAYAFVFM